MVVLTEPCTTADDGKPFTTKLEKVAPVPADTDDTAPVTLEVTTGANDVPLNTVRPVRLPVLVCVCAWFGAADTKVPTSMVPFITDVTVVADALNDKTDAKIIIFFIFIVPISLI